MRKNRSPYASKNYPNLYRFPDSPYWQFRKYSSEKREEFRYSTKEAKNEAKAYKIGQDAFTQWLGRFAGGSKTVTIRDLALEILEAKSSKKENTQRTTKNQLKNHIIPNFGHLRPDQITAIKWDQYDARERLKPRFSTAGNKLSPRTKLFNTRKALLEILHRAEEMGYIHRIPELKNHDAASAPPTYLDRKTIRAILKNVKAGNTKKVEGEEAPLSERIPPTKLLAFIMWKQGARPGEILRYRFSMINWKEGPHGTIHIPASITKTGRARTIPLNSRVARVLRWLQARVSTDLIFPSLEDPNQAQKTYRTAWDKACARVGVNATIYALRDTYITDRLRQGFSSVFIAKYCDTSAVMIDRKYAVAEESIMKEIAR